MKRISLKKGSVLISLGLILIAAAIVFACCNLLEQHHAKLAADSTLEQLLPQISTATEEAVPNYKLNPNMDMPEKEIDGYSYIGILQIPQMKLNLPVATMWENSASKIALCRYSGSVYLDNMIIAGHNYSGFFGGLNGLNIGDEVSFTDIDGNVFEYKVAGMEVLAATDIDKMESDDWPLTLFTCTVGGQNRIAVRCEYAQSDIM